MTLLDQSEKNERYKLSLKRHFKNPLHRHKQTARCALGHQVRIGAIVPPDRCEKCGVVADVHGHHEDYSKPLDVQWLCSTCHGLAHRGRKTHCKNGHLMSPDNIYMRAGGKRHCRTCRTIDMRKFYERSRAAGPRREDHGAVVPEVRIGNDPPQGE